MSFPFSCVRSALLLSATALVGSVEAARWPQWRGPNRDGVVAAPFVPSTWPEKLTVRWTYSSPVVHGGRVVVHSREDPDEIVTAFDLASGTPVWTARYPAP